MIRSIDVPRLSPVVVGTERAESLLRLFIDYVRLQQFSILKLKTKTDVLWNPFKKCLQIIIFCRFLRLLCRLYFWLSLRAHDLTRNYAFFDSRHWTIIFVYMQIFLLNPPFLFFFLHMSYEALLYTGTVILRVWSELLTLPVLAPWLPESTVIFTETSKTSKKWKNHKKCDALKKI